MQLHNWTTRELEIKLVDGFIEMPENSYIEVESKLVASKLYVVEGKFKNHVETCKVLSEHIGQFVTVSELFDLLADEQIIIT